MEHEVEGGEIAGGDDGFLVQFVAEEGGVEGDAADEALGAVDGVENPAIGLVVSAALFFAKDRFAGVAGLDEGADLAFGLLVGDGDGGRVFLDFDFQLVAEVGKGKPACAVGRFEGKGKPGRHLLKFTGLEYIARMNRREFLAVSAGAVGALCLAEPGVTSMAQTGSVHKRRQGVWTHPNPKLSEAELKTLYSDLRGHGINTVFIGGVDAREYEIARTEGLEVHSWIWTTNRGDKWIREHHPDWYMVSRTGKSCFDQPPYVDYYRWVSPVIPGFIRYLEEEVDRIASMPSVNGVHLDYVRYPDVILPRGLWEKYHLDQSEELPEYDFCYSPHTREAFKKASGRDPLEIVDPSHDREWLHFRYNSVTHLVQKLHQQVKRHQKTLTAAVFPTPSRARKICRQDWDKWPLDEACPMTYHSFYNRGVDFIDECLVENIQAARFPINAGLYMPAFATLDEFRAGLKIVKHRGCGVSLFGDVHPEFWEVFSEEMA